MKKDNGFTLVELMITLVVVGILVTIGIPSFQTLLQSSRMSTQSNEFVTGLNTARSEAVRRNESVRIEPLNGNDWEDGFVIPDPDDGAWDPDSEDQDPVRVFEAFGEGLTLSGFNGSITFLGDGSIDADGALTFTLQPEGDCLGDMRREVTLSLSGATRMEVLPCQ